jgi:hypothetical protein
MKSSLLTLIAVSSVVLSGCFRNADNCATCTGDAADTIQCSACPTDAMAPEATIVIDDENTPSEDEFIAVVEDEK